MTPIVHGASFDDLTGKQPVSVGYAPDCPGCFHAVRDQPGVVPTKIQSWDLAAAARDYAVADGLVDLVARPGQWPRLRLVPRLRWHSHSPPVHSGPDASLREPLVLVAGDPLPVRLGSVKGAQRI